MKIILANYRYFVAGGPERYMFNFMKEAEKRGIECIPFSVNYTQNIDTPYSKYFVSPRGKKSQLNFSEINYTPRNIIKLLQSSIWNFEAAKKLKKLIRDTKPDAVYILHQINALSPSIIRAAEKEGVRVIHRVSDFFMLCPRCDFLCDDNICEKCINGKYIQAIIHRCVKNSFCATLVRVLAMKIYHLLSIYSIPDAYIATCQFTKYKMIEGGFPENKIIHIPTFTRCNEITPCFEHQNYILFLGRLNPQKGVIYAVKAMTLLNDLTIKLKITGTLDDTDQSKILSALIQDESLESRIEFVGFKSGNELDELINNAICIVNPAIWYENMPNTVIEAFAHGKPVIASKIGSLSEMIDNDITGYLFEPKNHIELAEKIRLMVEYPNHVTEMGKNARELCINKFSPQKHFEKLLSLFEQSNEKIYRSNN